MNQNRSALQSTLLLRARSFTCSLLAQTFLLVTICQAEPLNQADVESKLNELSKALSELKNTVTSQQQRIDELESENRKLKQTTDSAANAAVVPSATTGAVPMAVPMATPSTTTTPAPVVNASAFNPEIGVIADVTGIATESGDDFDGNDKLSVRELELVLGHDVDPYSRLDVTLALSDFHDAEIEEAYLTHWGLPFDIGAKLGRLRPKIGKANAIHRDSLDTTDEPMVVEEYFGAEGLSRTALELSYYFPTPSEDFAHDLTLGLMEGGNGEGGTALGETTRRPTYYSHYRTSYDASDDTNLELGGTYMIGSSDDDSKNEVNIFGADATLIHHFNPINRFKLQTEAYFQDRDEASINSGHSHDDEEAHGHEEHGDEEHEEDEHEHEEHDEEVEMLGFDRSPLGYYVLADYRLSERFGLGARYDYVQPTNGSEGPRNADTGYTSYLTFYQSEFARWRAQYQHLDFADGGNDNRYFLQGTFAIGVHKHAIQ